MTRLVTIALIALAASAAAGQDAPAPEPVRLTYAGFAAGGRPVALQVEHSVRTQADDKFMQFMAIPDRRRVMSGRLEPRRTHLAGGRARVALELEDFQLQVWQDQNELSPLGADAMESLQLVVEVGDGGPLGPAGFGDETDRDATSWAASEPLAELVRQAVDLGLPRLPADGIAPGDAWSRVWRMPAALVSLPGVQVEAYHFYLYLGQVDCGADRCGRVVEIIHVSSFERRLFGDSMISVQLNGVGQATHLVRLNRGGPLEVHGSLRLDAVVSSHDAPGLPPSYVTRSTIETRYGLAPVAPPGR